MSRFYLTAKFNFCSSECYIIEMFLFLRILNNNEMKNNYICIIQVCTNVCLAPAAFQFRLSTNKSNILYVFCSSALQSNHNVRV